MRKLWLLLVLLLASTAYAADMDRLVLGGMPTMNVDSGSTTAQNHPIDSSDDTLAFIYQMPEAVTITSVGFRYGARTGTPPTYDVTIEGVSATTGDRDGTDKGGGSATLTTFTPPADGTWDNTWRTITLTNPYTTTRGELLALAIGYNTGTIDGSNFSSFTYSFQNTSGGKVRPYSMRVSNGGGATRSTDMMGFLFNTSTESFGQPVLSPTKVEINSTDNPDEYALRFNLDANWVSTYTVVGAQINGRSGASSATYDVVLYDGTTALQTVTVDIDQQSNNENGKIMEVFFDETTLSTLSGGSTYRLGLQPQAGSTRVSMYTYQAENASELSAWPGGTEFYHSTRVDAGSWTDDTTERPVVNLIIGDWTVPAGSGETFTGGKFNFGIN